MKKQERDMMRAPCITEILPNGSWKGKTCFLIGGGPSLKNFDFSPLKDELTIGINKSFIRFPTTINYAMDERFYRMITDQKQWLAYRGIKVFLRRRRRDSLFCNVYTVKKLNRKVISFDLKQGIWGGNNSGFGALMLAIGLGATLVGLLGYDLKVGGTGRGTITHWHGGYSFGGSPESFQGKLDKFIEGFEEFAPAIEQQGIEVVNLNPDSALECFPMQDIETFLLGR